MMVAPQHASHAIAYPATHVPAHKRHDQMSSDSKATEDSITSSYS